MRFISSVWISFPAKTVVCQTKKLLMKWIKLYRFVCNICEPHTWRHSFEIPPYPSAELVYECRSHWNVKNAMYFGCAHCSRCEASKFFVHLFNVDHIYFSLAWLQEQCVMLLHCSSFIERRTTHNNIAQCIEHIKWKIEQNTTLFVVQHSFVVILFIFISFNALPNRFIVMYAQSRDANIFKILNESLFVRICTATLLHHQSLSFTNAKLNSHHHHHHRQQQQHKIHISTYSKTGDARILHHIW